MKQYKVKGMRCAACSTRVEKAIAGIPGVTACAVSLLTNSMSVEGDFSEKLIISAVEKAGYEAIPGGGIKETNEKDISMKTAIKRFCISLVFLIILMYFSMGHNMWGFPLPSWFEGNEVSTGLVQMILSAIIIVVNQSFFINGFRGLVHKAPNMDTLVALGSGASFVYSICVLFLMAKAQSLGEPDVVHQLSMNFYFESAAMILVLITVGKMLETHSKGKTTDALKSLMKLRPETAVVLKDGAEKRVPVEQVCSGDVFCVRPGEQIPVDGTVLEGESAVNEAALTGESMPVDKLPGDSVSAATINQSGFLQCEATNTGENTAFAQIIKMVSDASATKAPISKVADRVSGVFVPIVICLAVLTVCIWAINDASLGYALARGISVLVISCPCALGLATPVAVMVGNGIGAKNGILYKNAVSLEETGKSEIVVLDKTGTITEGIPTVTDICACEGMSPNELLQMALSLEVKSEHPLSIAIKKRAEEIGIEPLEVEQFREVTGNGLTGELTGTEICGGNLSFLKKKINVPDSMIQLGETLALQGKTPMYFGSADQFWGLIAVADKIKKDSAKAIEEIKHMGMQVYMLTGDYEKTACVIGDEAGVDHVIAGVLPDRKEAVVKSLRNQGKVIMVGDGINDAPALAGADIGVAIGTGTDVAIDAADIVLMKGNLLDLAAAIRLSRQTLKNIHENLFWAFVYNAIGIPLAMGIWIPIFGWTLNPMFGAAAMSLSSFCVVSNALRLNVFPVYSTKKDKKIKRKIKEKRKLKKIMEIEGMMCGHCEARVKQVLEEIPEVSLVEVNHETDTAVLIMEKEVSDELLKNTVEKQGYDVIRITHDM